MADSGLMKWALLGGAAFIAYKYFFSDGSTATAPPATLPPVPMPTPGPVLPGPPVVVAPPPPPPPPNPPAVPGYNSAAALFARIQQAVGSNTTQTPDAFNYIANAQGAPGPLPDPVSLFGGRDPMTLAQWWAVTSAWLSQNKGLTGFGLYYGLGRLAGVC